jgi:hypothetical protein
MPVMQVIIIHEKKEMTVCPLHHRAEMYRVTTEKITIKLAPERKQINDIRLYLSIYAVMLSICCWGQ